MAEITTTLVVSFSSGAGAAGVLRAEVDSRENGYNNGRSSFTAGDAPAYLITKTDDVTISSQVPSTGTIQIIGTGTRVIEETLQFVNEREKTLQYPAQSGSLTFKWLGTNLGTLLLPDAVTVRAPNLGVAVAKVTYISKFTAYRINNVVVPLNGESTFPVVVLITGATP